MFSFGFKCTSMVFCFPRSKALNKMFSYNHKQSEWREMAAMKTPRAMFGATIHKGKIVVAGGVNEEGLSAACEAFDFATNKYEPVPHHSVTLLHKCHHQGV